MPPYTPNYLKQAKHQQKQAFKAYIDFIDDWENSGADHFSREMAEALDRLDKACAEANETYSRLWDKWQEAQALFHKLALNESAEGDQPSTLSEQRNEQFQYNTFERTMQ